MDLLCATKDAEFVEFVAFKCRIYGLGSKASKRQWSQTLPLILSRSRLLTYYYTILHERLSLNSYNPQSLHKVQLPSLPPASSSPLARSRPPLGFSSPPASSKVATLRPRAIGWAFVHQRATQWRPAAAPSPRPRSARSFRASLFRPERQLFKLGPFAGLLVCLFVLHYHLFGRVDFERACVSQRTVPRGCQTSPISLSGPERWCYTTRCLTPLTVPPKADRKHKCGQQRVEPV
uniref:ARID domain-containing protein n=1 Tax=Steinernema glaseri TaxID=37863 RepID=A0A1I7ZHG0_9BILA